MRNIEISAPERESISVDLVGKRYVMRPPKAALSIAIARRAKEVAALTTGDGTGEDVLENVTKMLDVFDDWLERAFAKKDVKAIRARMEDPEDDLDFPQLITLIEKVVEYTTGNPTS